MKKYKFYITPRYSDSEITMEVFEFEDDVTREQIQKAYEDWIQPVVNRSGIIYKGSFVEIQASLPIRKTRRFHSAIKNRMEINWISTKEKLPRERHDVLLWAYWHESWQVLKGYWCGLSWYTHDGKQLYDVSHWMPLPQPPKED